MLNIEKVTKLTPKQVLERAIGFFGPNGWGLDVVESGGCCARFRGLGGFVLVQTDEAATHGKTRVSLQGKEIENGIREFLQALPD